MRPIISYLFFAYSAPQKIVYNFENSEMSSIERVDQLIRHNNKKYAEQKHQQHLEAELKHFSSIRKTEALKSYANLVKEGNKRALQKSKTKKEVRKITNHKINQQENSKNENEEDRVKTKKTKLSEEEVKKVQAVIDQRAKKIHQQKKLESLEKQLGVQRKKTQLYQLNEKCKKLIKSHAKIPQTSSIPEKRRLILQKFEQKALEQVEELDQIIEEIILGQQNIGSSVAQKAIPEQRKVKKINNYKDKAPEIKRREETQSRGGCEQILFSSTAQDLLSLEYIPI